MLSASDVLANADIVLGSIGEARSSQSNVPSTPSWGLPFIQLTGSTVCVGGPNGQRVFRLGRPCCSSTQPVTIEFLDVARSKTVAHMSHHVTNVGVHDHGFNNVSTYGGLLRLMNEGRIDESEWERNFYETCS